MSVHEITSSSSSSQDTFLVDLNNFLFKYVPEIVLYNLHPFLILLFSNTKLFCGNIFYSKCSTHSQITNHVDFSAFI